MKKCLSSWLILYFLFSIPTARAQIPVGKDPFHKIVFENKFVRVLDLVVSGPDTTKTHVHSAASVVVFLTKSFVAIQAPGGPPVVTKVDNGTVVYRPYDETPATHKVWSQDGSTMRCMVIEIRPGSARSDSKPVSASNANLLSNQKLANVYDLKISPADTFSLGPSSCPYFLLNVSGPVEASLSGRKFLLKESEFVFIPAQSQVTLRASEDNKCILIQLK
ncbi:hypothetical protein SAMN04488109_1881 [Chryseolinea serpens]|uniref:Uncharacterized protein n=1 Tax=Chryseolinea serpens TaxID=947013 RepID=A0A1M5MR08_9BACT|nr:hypothetical protein [Chryseolinea serpens]SHG79645.1 hypothetical protein SAMN04488109_1881 [Chryseolinea serpens]